jgi:hypothetical protein
MPTLTPVSVVPPVAPSSTLCELAWAMPVADACNGPWLFSLARLARVALVVALLMPASRA